MGHKTAYLSSVYYRTDYSVEELRFRLGLCQRRSFTSLAEKRECAGSKRLKTRSVFEMDIRISKDLAAVLDCVAPYTMALATSMLVGFIHGGMGFFAAFFGLAGLITAINIAAAKIVLAIENASTQVASAVEATLERGSYRVRIGHVAVLTENRDNAIQFSKRRDHSFGRVFPFYKINFEIEFR